MNRRKPRLNAWSCRFVSGLLLCHAVFCLAQLPPDQQTTFLGREHTRLGNATLDNQTECLVINDIGDLVNGAANDGFTIEIKFDDVTNGFTTIFEDVCLDKPSVANQAFSVGVGGEYDPGAQDFFSGVLLQNFSGGDSIAIFPFFNVLPASPMLFDPNVSVAVYEEGILVDVVGATDGQFAGFFSGAKIRAVSVVPDDPAPDCVTIIIMFNQVGAYQSPVGAPIATDELRISACMKAGFSLNRLTNVDFRGANLQDGRIKVLNEFIGTCEDAPDECIGAPPESPCGKGRCPEDLNGDFKVDMVDFGIFQGEFGRADCSPENNYCNCADLDRDGDVDLTDFSQFSSKFLSPDCGPIQEFWTITNFGDEGDDNFIPLDLPADFFGPGCEPFNGPVPLQGVPLDPENTGDASQIITRFGDPIEPGDPNGQTGQADIELRLLGLSSINPISVQCNGSPQLWNVMVEPSPTVPSTGTITATKTHDNGGIFDYELTLNPQIIFTDPNSGAYIIVDFQNSMPISYTASGIPFVNYVSPLLGTFIDINTNFVPGVVETVPGDPNTQEIVTVTRDAPGGRETVTLTHCGEPQGEVILEEIIPDPNDMLTISGSRKFRITTQWQYNCGIKFIQLKKNGQIIGTAACGCAKTCMLVVDEVFLDPNDLINSEMEGCDGALDDVPVRPVRDNAGAMGWRDLICLGQQDTFKCGAPTMEPSWSVEQGADKVDPDGLSGLLFPVQAVVVSDAFKDIQLQYEAKDGDGDIGRSRWQLSVPQVNAIIHNGLEGVSGGQEIPEADEETVGAVTVANLNDTDGDNTIDRDDNDVSVGGGTTGRDEHDLMKLILKRPVSGGGGKMTLIVDGGDVKLWEKKTKETEIVLAGGKVEFNANKDKTVWVEARAVSPDLRDIELTFDYMGCKDKVKATGLWVEQTRVFHVRAVAGGDNAVPADLDDPSVLDRITKDRDASGIGDLALDGSRYGIGTQAAATPGGGGAKADSRIGGRILHEFEIKPHGVEDIGVIFDVTRQLKARDRRILDGTGMLTVPPGLPDLDFPAEEAPPRDNETPTDDNHADDEDDQPTNHFIYSYDSPSSGVNANAAFLIKRDHFKEWVRIRLSGAFTNNNGLVEGSRASDKEDWHLLDYLRINAASQWEPDTMNPSHAAPIRSGTGNGPIAIGLLADAETEGFTAIYTAATQTWTLNGTGGGSVNDMVAGPVPQGTTWTLTMGTKVQVTITQGATAFADGDQFMFDIFKTTAGGGKQNEIAPGPIDVLDGP